MYSLNRRGHHSASSQILAAINELDDIDAKKTILTQYSDNLWTPLSLAGCFQEDMVGPILDTLVTVFSDTTGEDLAAYDGVFRSMYTTKEYLLGGIRTLQRERQIELLEQSLDPSTLLGRQMSMSSVISWVTLDTIRKALNELKGVKQSSLAEESMFSDSEAADIDPDYHSGDLEMEEIKGTPKDTKK